VAGSEGGAGDAAATADASPDVSGWSIKVVQIRLRAAE